LLLVVPMIKPTPIVGSVAPTSKPEKREVGKPVLLLNPSYQTPNKPPSNVQEPYKPVLRHSQGVQHIGLHTGLSSIGYKAMGDWGLRFSSFTKMSLLLGLEWKEQETALYRRLFLGPVVGYTVFSTNHLYIKWARRPTPYLYAV
jgi:hypothetical protein